MEIPDVRYARSGDVAIAYEVVGDGPIDIVFARGFAGELLSMWEYPYLVWFIEQLETFSRVIMLDKRGTGLSDRVRVVPTLETRMDDLRAVMDAVESERALLWTAQDGARLATLFAATYPERTAGLFLFDPTARGRRAPDYPWAPSDDEWRALLADVRDRWGTTEVLLSLLDEWAPTMREDEQFRAWFVSHMRPAVSRASSRHRGRRRRRRLPCDVRRPRACDRVRARNRCGARRDRTRRSCGRAHGGVRSRRWKGRRHCGQHLRADRGRGERR